jgi:dienelactone hydrolase
MVRYRVIFFLCLVTTVSYGQQIFEFKTGLVLPQCHKYGREALVTDQLAYAMYSGQLKKPVAGESLSMDASHQELEWKLIEADTAGRFRGDDLISGYLYLIYESYNDKDALLNVSGNSMCYFNGVPHTGDIYGDGWMKIPVRLRKGVNEIMVRCSMFSRWLGVSAKLVMNEKPVLVSIDDLTLPHVLTDEPVASLLGGAVVMNNTDKSLTGLSITTTLNGKQKQVKIPEVTPRSTRKVGFEFDPSSTTTAGDHACRLQLVHGNTIIDEKTITIAAVTKRDHNSYTFISAIDGSVQYYSVAPQSGNEPGRPAMFLSVHGAGVEAIGQARAYKPKEWGVVVTPTNRRPRGFNWEDWGRLDALEVLELAKTRYNPAPERIYLTGHSMGGHGTWYLGATFPDRWAAIAPCAGYPTLTAYGSADGKIPENARTKNEELLLRASNQSNVTDLVKNYKDLGIYIHHGDSDKVVSVDYARQMRQLLSNFHSDFTYYEYPGGSHWFGNESVDWPPLFDFFKSHIKKPDSAVNTIEFTTSNPAISSSYRWATVVQQKKPLVFSHFHLERNKDKRLIKGNTTNIATLQIDLPGFSVGDTVTVYIDSVKIKCIVNSDRRVLLGGHPEWKLQRDVNQKHKNPIRYGTFKEAFNHKMVFVFGTKGEQKENDWAYNKARYDAEVWYYRGNGAIDLVADVNFKPENFKDRGVIIYGNADTNLAWNKLLKDCPIHVSRDRVRLGTVVYKGSGLGAYFAWPRGDSHTAMVGVVTGTGLQGMRTAEPNQYFAAGSGFPDYLIFSASMLKDGASGIKAAGFFDNEWQLDEISSQH